MSKKHVFCAIMEQRTPQPGDLIRSTNTGNMINIVLQVSKPFYENRIEVVAVRSVRYGVTNGGVFELLNGQRSRSILMPTTDALKGGAWSGWMIVDEYVKADNDTLRADIVHRMRHVDTVYRGE